MDIKYFEQKLREELAVVEEELSDLGHEEVDETATESDELADRQEEFGEHTAEKQVLVIRRREIVDALAKIAKGTYGTCEVSGEKIEEDRLEANPAARTCKAHMNS